MIKSRRNSDENNAYDMKKKAGGKKGSFLFPPALVCSSEKLLSGVLLSPV